MKELALWNYADWAAVVASVTLLAFLVVGAWVLRSPKPEVFGHPKGLYMLFFAEMWERFSFYGMKALLVLYLTQHWQYLDGEAVVIVGAYGSLVYITPVLGGWIADNYLGQRKAVAFGAILLTIGHFFMAFEGDGSGYQNDPVLNVFWLALAFIIVGSGFLKANISVLVGQLYSRTDERRDSAYTIFYMGINLGALAGILIAAYIGETTGSWAYGFGLAGLGMLLGLIVFVIGKPLLLGNGEPPVPAKLKEKVVGIRLEPLLYGVGLVGVAAIWLLIQYRDLVGAMLMISGIILLAYVLFLALYELDDEAGTKSARTTQNLFRSGVGLLLLTALLIIIRGAGASLEAVPAFGATLARLSAILSEPNGFWVLLALAGFAVAILVVTCVIEARKHANPARDRVFAMIFFILLMPLFWGLFEQAAGSMNLFTLNYVDRDGIPATFFQSLNSIFIILLAPLFAIGWQWLSRRGAEPSTPAKMGLGILQMGLAFVLLVYGADLFSVARVVDGELVLLMPVFFLFVFYFFSTTGELSLSPVGLSAMNRLSEKHMASLMMAAFFFGIAGGNYVAGALGSIMGSGAGGDMTRDGALDVYWVMGWVAINVGIFVVVVSPLVKKLMHLDRLRDDNVSDDLLGQGEVAEPSAGGVAPETRPAE
ncbi:MAG: oligopeptide:H+ symporter [Pseudomonadota bacterium]